MTLALGPLLSLIAGILILVVPRLLNYIVAIYLILVGLVGLFGGGRFQGTSTRRLFVCLEGIANPPRPGSVA